MPSSFDVVCEAREWVGTPYQHCQWLKRQGADCIGLCIGVARHAGAYCPADNQIPHYGQFPHGHVAERTADLFMDATGWGWPSATMGRVGLFWWKERGHGQHFAIFTDRGSMIHSFLGIGHVVEQRVSPFWRKRLIKVYTLRGVAE